MKKNILIINGPNLNMLGTREVDVYGKSSYKDLLNYIKTLATQYDIKIKVVQTNHEGKIIDFIQKATLSKYIGVILNPGAYTHYSYAIKDAIKAIETPVVEVHLTDIYSREEFRKVSVISEDCVTTFSGKHFESYKHAILYLINKI